MRFAESDSSDETATSTSDTTESSAGGQTDKEISDVDLKEDRFRVDRRKLEQMLQGETSVSNGQTAEDFFHRIMEETSTQISWPSKLKVGAKSKKDPHIKITGDPDNVTSAREKVLEVLDTKRNRVTLKMDVSFTDHSHIIGKGGHSIQQVMEDTGCHIHFPDSNRNSIGEKSNQVSIAGLPSGVEKARCRIRDLLPMVLTFDLPLSGGFLQPLADVSSPAIQMIQQRHGFTITFRPKQRLTTVVVRGSRRLFPQLRQGVLTLMEYLTGNAGTVLPVNLSVEVAPQHQAFVMGRGNGNVASISRETGVSLTFPDPALFSGFSGGGGNPMNLQVPQQANIQPRRSTVVISGHIDGVCTAWQELMGCLPLVLMFDLKEGQELDTAQVTSLMDQLNINIVIRPKPKQNTKCLLVRGAERDSRLLFEVRRQLLQVDPAEEPLPVCCQKHFDTSYSGIQGIIPGLGGGGSYESCKESIIEVPMKEPPSLSNINNNSHNNYSNGFPGYQRQSHSQMMAPPQVTNNSDTMTGAPGAPPAGNYPLLPWLLNQLSGHPSSIYNALLQAHMSDMALASLLSRSLKDFSRGPPLSDQASCSGSSQASSLSSPNLSPCESPIFMSGNAPGSTPSHSSSCSGSLDSLPAVEKADSFSSGPSWNNPFWLGSNGSSGGSEPYSDLSDTSMMSVSSYEQQHASVGMQPSATNQQTPHVAFQPRATLNQGRPIVAASSNSASNGNLSSLGSDAGSLKGIGSVGCERRSRDLTGTAYPLADYSMKKMQAVQAIQKPVSSGARVPTDVWSGYGFSKTLPEDLLRNRLQESRVLHRRVETIPEQIEDGTREDNWFNQTSTAMQESFPEKKLDYAVSVDTGVPFSCSNYFDNNLLPLDLTKEIKDLTNLLSLLSLEKYSEVFQQQQVDLATFLTLTDRDLQELSIPFFARRKMLKAISELNLHGDSSLTRHQQFQPAPGAERRAMFARFSQQPGFGTSLSHDW